MSSAVCIWEEAVTIPTYRIGPPNPNPMFLDNRVYQGSSGVVYPYPVVDSVTDCCEPQTYSAVFLENEYLKIMILPELGGRVQMALDKTNDYHFVYYNRVIKPALVGLAGPWISGGIEFNWPQHHRPSTFSAIPYDIVTDEDGGQTVWCSEVDRMHGTKGMHGFRLHPEKAYLEVVVKLFNGTDLPQTFLWWANPAVRVDEHHQSVFPPDVDVVLDHGKRDVSSFPIATGNYYKIDYSPGTDISRYKNIPVPTSYMAHRSDYNFVGSYDHGRRAGLLHVANHHISPGKKQWTWGNGDFGHAWNRHLTDEDGQYVELMAGVYTDNQPDFSWLSPGEEKSFTQVFMPYKDVGMVKNATVNAVIGFELCGGTATLRVYTTAIQVNAKAVLFVDNAEIASFQFDSSPAQPFATKFPVPFDTVEWELKVIVYDRNGRELVKYAPSSVKAEIPESARPIDAPDTLDSLESLYLAGTHLEQYRHATRRPEDYYREGLRRDPGDARCNLALGQFYLRRGSYQDAEQHFRRGINRVTRHNPNPPSGDLHYHLGLALELQHRHDEAYAAYYKATWNADACVQARYALARIACRKQDWDEALEHVESTLRQNAQHHQAQHLRVYLLIQTRNHTEARRQMEEALSADPFNGGLLFEYCLLLPEEAHLFAQRIGNEIHAYLAIAEGYARFGAFDRSADVLRRYQLGQTGCSIDPLLHYHLAYYLDLAGEYEERDQALSQAAEGSRMLCFPNRLESISALQNAVKLNARDASAHYYLGNLWYSKGERDKAITCWESSAELDTSFPTSYRNLALAYFNHCHDADRAWSAISRAFALDPTDARVMYELDQLAKRLGHDPLERIERLESNFDCVQSRDDLYLEYVTLMNQVGRCQDALNCLLERRFHPWEGGEGKVPQQFVYSTTQLARQALADGNFDKCLALLAMNDKWPESLGEGKLASICESRVEYLKGLALQRCGNDAEASACFERASMGLQNPQSAVFYNDEPPDGIYYQGLALLELGQEDSARDRFRQLVEYSEQHYHDNVVTDFFAVSLPEFLVFEDDLRKRHKVHCHYMKALGLLGLGHSVEAQEQFSQVLNLDVNHLGALCHRKEPAPTSVE